MQLNQHINPKIMKLLAIEKETSLVNWDVENEILINESYQVYHLFQEGIIRDIYFTENKDAVIILECVTKEEALNVLSTLPLVKEGLISFEVIELRPYTGFDRIIMQQIQ
jgi:hypothetical protein